MEEKDSIFENIEYPSDLKKVNKEDLDFLCEEIRQYIIDECAKNPGHLGASLGTVELTIALHYVLNTPYDNLIWDVGHQAYTHKIITGRKEAFKNQRKLNGISGFPKMTESEYDAFGTGHASTSISAILGMAIAASLQGEKDRMSVAVIGDGSLTGGLAYEALNNAGVYKSNVLVILNDNNMAIDPNVGGISNYLLDVTTSKTYNRLKKDVWRIISKLDKVSPKMLQLIQGIDGSFKSILMQRSNLFEAMGFRYFGPVDGHDTKHLIRVLEDLKHIKGPKLLHCITKKGKGFKCAEESQTVWHSPGKFNTSTGEIIKDTTNINPPKFQDVFGETLLELAENNPNIVGITPAMPSGCSMNIMMKEMPERCFDVGIAEGHAVTFSGGLAAKGMVPFCNIYSSFMQRAYDNIIHDVAIQKLPVIFCLDRGGLVGSDGATHHGAFDLSYLRCIPNIIISSPLNEEYLRNLMYTAQLRNNGPFSIRYPRGNGSMINWKTPFKEIEIGKGRCIKEGEDIAIISIGNVGIRALEAANMLDSNIVAVYDMIFLKPIDKELLHTIFKKFKKIITIEDGTIIGGLGSAVVEFMVDHKYNSEIYKMGITDKFIEHGTQEELYKKCQYDTESIYNKIIELIN